MIIEENPIVSAVASNNVSFMDKIVYFLEYGIAIVVGIGLFTFLWFFIGDKVDGGILFFVIWLFIVLSSDVTVAQLVIKDIKKLQAKGVSVGKDLWGWTIFVYMYPIIGVSWYLACRRADYKKQIPSISPENQPQ